MFNKVATLSIFSLFAGTCLSANSWNTLDGNPPRFAGHRGEKAFLPEHSFGSYHQAALESVDYIEPDLVLSKDGKLVVLHNEWLSDTTNVANLTQFANRKRQYVFDGKFAKINRTDWWVFDFTVDELKTIKLRQAPEFAYRPQYYNNDFSIPTFEEYLDEVESLTKILDREFGIIPELKSPEVFNALFPSANGRGFEDGLLEVLQRRGYTVNQPPPQRGSMKTKDLIDWVMNVKSANYQKPNYKLATIQSFDQDTCQYLAKTTKVPIVALDQSHPTYFTPKGIQNIATYADTFSVGKDLLVAGPQAFFDLNNITYSKQEIESMGGFLTPKQIVAEAHKCGLKVCPYTLYDSRQSNGLLCSRVNDTRLAWCPKNRKEELYYFFDLGVDSLFVENIFEAQMLRLAYNYELAL
ncbi:hypothetical protein BB560_003037 [Smittium megazygosporum]|uniref:glycerophosphodiester phosphodiesterase n=1 Tax=Smittium megazygosporum TaxID=133381 RepID=A0A2T9ZD32_9FUNG|nr:hypothetical protein BB560_003037 [Smittium megazygosporum]